MSWTLHPLGDICLVQRGTTITQTQTRPGNIPVVAGGMSPTYFHDTPNRDGQVITISASGASAGYVNFWIDPIFASDCSTVEAVRKDVNINFVYHFLRSKQEYINAKLRSGAAQPHVYAKDIAKLDFPLPPLPEQHRIAAILDQAETLRTQRCTALALLDTLTQSIFLDMFGDPLTNTNRQRTAALGDLCTRITDGTHQSPTWETSGVPFLFISNIVDGQITFETHRSISEETYSELTRRCPIEVGDVLYTTVGSYGNAAIVETTKKFAFQRHIAHIKPDPKKADSVFISAMIQSYGVRRQVDKVAKGVAQKTVNLSDLKNLVVFAPPLPLQKTFATRIAAIEALKSTHRAALAELDALFASLQHRAFSGTL